jgi:hypothetical protein
MKHSLWEIAGLRQSQLHFVIPASEARRESFFGQRKIPDKPE